MIKLNGQISLHIEWITNLINVVNMLDKTKIGPPQDLSFPRAAVIEPDPDELRSPATKYNTLTRLLHFLYQLCPFRHGTLLQA